MTAPFVIRVLERPQRLVLPPRRYEEPAAGMDLPGLRAWLPLTDDEQRKRGLIPLPFFGLDRDPPLVTLK